LGGAAVACPFAARAQQSAMPGIGDLSGRSSEAETQYATAFRQGLEDAGYVEGQKLALEVCFFDGQDDPLPAVAADLVRREVAVLVATDTPSTLAAKAASATTPIVFSTGTDSVKLGLVDSLNRPNSDATGLAVFV